MPRGMPAQKQFELFYPLAGDMLGSALRFQKIEVTQLDISGFANCLHVISDGFDYFFGICMLFESGPPPENCKVE